MDYLLSVLTKVRSIRITDPEENRNGVPFNSPTNLDDLSNFGLFSYDFGSVDYYSQSPTGYHALSGYFDIDFLINRLRKHEYATEQDCGDPILQKSLPDGRRRYSPHRGRKQRFTSELVGYVATLVSDVRH